MLNFGLCPVCQNEIREERLNEAVVICQSCGWTDNQKNTLVQRDLNKKFNQVIFGVSILLVASFIHAVEWGEHFWGILPIKSKQVLGMTNASDLNQLAQICTDLEKPKCIEDAYRQIARINPNNTENLAKYGKILVENKSIRLATKVFSQYFRLGGTDHRTALRFAKVLGENNRIKEAKQYFQYALKAKPKFLQITVTQDYVKLLLDHNQLHIAKKVIEKFQKKGDNAKYFMNNELDLIKKTLRGKKRRRKKRSSFARR